MTLVVVVLMALLVLPLWVGLVVLVLQMGHPVSFGVLVALIE